MCSPMLSEISRKNSFCSRRLASSCFRAVMSWVVPTAAQRLALLVELHLRPLRYPPHVVSPMTTRSSLSRRLSPERGGGGLLQGLAVVGVDQRHEGGQAADRSCGKTQDATGFGRHVYPAADQVVDPATDTATACARLRSASRACSSAVRWARSLAKRRTSSMALVRAHQKDDQEQGHNDCRRLAPGHASWPEWTVASAARPMHRRPRSRRSRARSARSRTAAARRPSSQPPIRISSG
jgi:hypothetical protein